MGISLNEFRVPLILVTGVVVGLILVISVIFCCKYCLNKNKNIPRKSKFWSRLSSSDKAPLKSRDYDSVVSTGSGDPSTQQHTPCINKQAETGTTTIAERLKIDHDNEIDAAVAEYRERCKSFDGDLESACQQDVNQPDVQRTSSVGDTSGSDVSRHVSFVITDDSAPAYVTPKQSPNKSRYTEGDFHHLKSARIDRPSLGKLRNLSGSGSSERSDYGGSINDDTISEVTPMLSPVCEEPSTTKTQVLAEVHRDPNGSRVDGLPAKLLGRSPIRLLKRDPITRQSSTLLTDNPTTASPRQYVTADKIKHPKHTLAVMKESGKDRHAWSLELVTPEQRWPHESRRVKSYEEDFVQKRRDSDYGWSQRRDTVDYDRSIVTQRRDSCIDYNRALITQFSSDLGVNVGSLSPECPTTKARYNDIGSFEDISVSPVLDGIILSESDTINGGKYKDLWNLRSTLESEEVDDDNLSDTLRMENMSSPDEMSVGERDTIRSITTSFESNTEPIADPSQSGTSEQYSSEDTVIMKGSSKLLHPNYESRRHTYQSMFSKKVKQRAAAAADNKPGGENSFDSLETMDTDGDVSESSRQEFTTTSFESTGTTDNTDSTGDSASHKLQQMRGDSGYKSLETQQSQCQADVITLAQHSKAPKKQIHFVFDDETVARVKGGGVRSTSLPETHAPSRHQYSRSHYFDRRGVKTASKKRREFRSDNRKQLRLQQGIQEQESDSRSDQPSGDSFEEAPKRERISFISKIMRPRSGQSPKRASLSRDYSIDEKTDAVFNEFLRHDPQLDKLSASRSSPQTQRAKFQRKSSEAFDSSTRPKHRISKGSRSASVDQSNMGVIRSLKKISPQDSIEEESIEMDIAKPWSSHDVPLQSKPVSSKSILKTESSKKEAKKGTALTSKQESKSSKSESRSRSPKHSASKTNPKIPIIKLNTDSTEV